MEVLQYTKSHNNMVPESINNQTYFFTINHITKEGYNKHIYGIRLNNMSYLLSKTNMIHDCLQLDTNPVLNPDILHELNDVLTEVERKFKTRPTLEQINREIFKLLVRHRNSGGPYSRSVA